MEEVGVVGGADERLTKVGQETVCRAAMVRVEDLGRGELTRKGELAPERVGGRGLFGCARV